MQPLGIGATHRVTSQHGLLPFFFADSPGYLEMILMWARTTHIQACAGGDSVTRKTTIEQELRSSRALQ